MPSTISREDKLGYLLEVRGLRNARRNRAKDALKRTKGATVARFVSESGLQLIVHRSTRTDRDGDWQITTIGYDGKPCGHCCADSFEEAVLRCVGASKSGYWNEHGYSLVEVAGVQS
jgi:transposase InsO family protein